MIKVIVTLEALIEKHTSYYYHVRRYNKKYNINLFLTPKDRIVISSTSYDDLVEVRTSKEFTKNTGVLIFKDALLEYLLYIIKAQFND